MPTNPNIAMGFRSPRIQAFDEAGAIQDGMKLKDMMLQGQVRQQQLQGAQRQANIDQIADEYVKSPEAQGMLQSGDHEGFINGLSRLGGMSAQDTIAFVQKKAEEAKKAKEIKSYAPGSALYQGDQQIGSVPDKPAPPSNVARLIAERDSLPPNTPPEVRKIYDNAIRKESETAQQIVPRVTVNGGGGTPYSVPVQTADGIFSFNTRTGRMERVEVGGAPVIGSQSDPALQGKIAGAKEVGQAEAKRDYNMGGVTSVIDQAEAILKGDVRPTQSVVGNLVDKAGSVVGAAPRGAAEADRLRAIAGQLVAKMPRMEGPQSNYDVQNYKEMAGDVGNPNIPIERRLAALQQVRTLISKYDKKAGKPANANTVTLPDGRVKTFPSAAAAQAFKKAAGL